MAKKTTKKTAPKTEAKTEPKAETASAPEEKAAPAKKLEKLSDKDRKVVEEAYVKLKRKVKYLHRLEDKKAIEEKEDGTKFDGRQYKEVLPKLEAELAGLKAQLDA